MNMNNYSNYQEYDNYPEIEPESTLEKCPNKCGALLVKWTEANSPDDYETVYYCNSCERRIDD